MDTNETATVEEQEVEPEAAPATPAPAAEESAKPKESDELKVVIIIKDNRVMLGVQSPDCDPVYTTLEGTLAAALKRVPKLVAEAKEKWTANPLNPEANLPTPEPTPTPARSSSRAAAVPKKKPDQPSFF